MSESPSPSNDPSNSSSPSPSHPATGPEAFGPGPATSPKSGAGCSRPLLLGCGLLLVLLGIGAVVLVLNVDKVVGWMFGMLEEQVMASLPEDVPEEDRVRLQRAFDRSIAAIREGNLNPAKLQQAQGKMMEMAQDPEAVTAEDVRELAELLEAAAGDISAGDTSAGDSTADDPTAEDPSGN